MQHTEQFLPHWACALRHLHLPLIFRNKFLNVHTELQEKAPNNDFVTLFLNAA